MFDLKSLKKWQIALIIIVILFALGIHSGIIKWHASYGYNVDGKRVEHEYGDDNKHHERR